MKDCRRKTALFENVNLKIAEKKPGKKWQNTTATSSRDPHIAQLHKYKARNCGEGEPEASKLRYGLYFPSPRILI